MVDIVDHIVAKKIDDGSKLIKLYSVVMLNYRQELGDKAWGAIARLFKNPSINQAFAFLMGFSMAGPSARYRDLIQEELGELDLGAKVV